jgi:hypothetical protein
VRVVGNGMDCAYAYPRHARLVDSQLLFHSCLCHPAVTIRRSLFTNDGFSYRVEFGEACDYDLWAQMAWRGRELVNLPRVLLHYRQHPSQVSRTSTLRQIKYADDIRRWQLRRLGVDLSDADLRVHSALGRFEISQGRGFVVAARTWLERLLLANATVRRYSATDFESVLASYWYTVCRRNLALGPWVVRAYGRSVLGRGRPLQYGKLACRVARSVWRRNEIVP